jgi:hypothetical protein
MEEYYNFFKETKTAGFKQVLRESLDDVQPNKLYHICCLLLLVSAEQL